MNNFSEYDIFVNVTSFEEFMMMSQITNITKMSKDAFVYIFYNTAENYNYTDILSNVILKSSIFDDAMIEPSFNIDYYMNLSLNELKHINSNDYVFFEFIENCVNYSIIEKYHVLTEGFYTHPYRFLHSFDKLVYKNIDRISYNILEKMNNFLNVKDIKSLKRIEFELEKRHINYQSLNKTDISYISI